ncbi:Uncharacterised protein [uncultured Roseburia sp.]|uniref:Zinc ribbon domain-containing protein n=1 Tax=Brotonthovivens ammoniilytica TaxID=2981725 RepID=A0ABT2TL11_9FIRM|nr:zinc ribbon domain-containing protein [Brotonthovivens ammoniilytica]MCU6762893.1 zinc ribbon domain-containing protein [Brotonthovivens ammoniilytica]SCI92848.1 Uncharacterised protein [uncultured Roseburia sp.]
MAFFDDLGKVIAEKGQGVLNKTKDLTEITKLSVKIADLQRKNENLYQTIGKMYMDRYGDHPDEAFKEAVHNVQENLKRIVNYKEDIKILKGYQKCDSCGADVQNGSQYCSACGSKVKEEDIVAEAEVVSEEVQEDDFREVKEEEIHAEAGTEQTPETAKTEAEA